MMKIKENKMDDSFSDIVSYQLKKLLPLISTILLILVAYIPVHVPLSKFLRADIGIICVYFWALYRRDLFGPVSVATIGIVADSLSSVPLGVNIFTFMLVYVLATTYGNFVNTKPFIVSWSGFAIISFVAFFSKWLVLSVYYSCFLSLIGVLLAFVATALIYPLIARLNMFVQNKFLANEEVVYEQR